MIALYATVLGSSVAGSLHCVAMCGPLVAMHGGARGVRLALVHAGGRLATYTALGVIAGLVGGAVDLAGTLAPVQHAATIAAGLVIIGWGAFAIFGRHRPAAAGGAAFRRGLVQVQRRRPVARAWLAGALTGLLPCGWLWAFVVAAAGTASPLGGGLLMAAFWLGTVPAMTGMLTAGGAVIARLRARMPAITACVLIALGVVTLATRWLDAGVTGVTAPHCHCHEAAP